METSFIYNTPHLIYWDWRIAADLFFGGIGVGAFLVAVLNSLYYKGKYSAISKTGAILSPILVILGLIFMMTEMGHPFRMWRTITAFNVSSPMSWGGVFQGLLIGIGVIYAYLWIKPGPARLRNIVGIVGIPVALIVGAYHGWLLTILRARPLWNTGPATITALLGFVITGMAAVLLVLCLLPKGFRQNGKSREQQTSQDRASSLWMIRDFRHILVAAMLIQGLTFFVWWISLYYGPTDAQGALAVANEELGVLFWVVGIGLGLGVPILLQLVEIVRHSKTVGGIDIPLTIVTTVLILIGGFVFRYAVVIAGQLS